MFGIARYLHVGRDCSSQEQPSGERFLRSTSSSSTTKLTLPTTSSSQINNECTNIYLGQVLCVASKSYPYILPTNITEPTSAGEEPVTSTVLPTNVPTTGAEPAAITMTESVWATVTSDAAGAVSTAAASQVSFCMPICRGSSHASDC